MMSCVSVRTAEAGAINSVHVSLTRRGSSGEGWQQKSVCCRIPLLPLYHQFPVWGDQEMWDILLESIISSFPTIRSGRRAGFLLNLSSFLPGIYPATSFLRWPSHCLLPQSCKPGVAAGLMVYGGQERKNYTFNIITIVSLTNKIQLC